MLPHKKHSLYHVGFIGAMLSSLVGCAVTTVDVDVYKGPLANHIEVQRLQSASIALASKPLLQRLRFSLEYSARLKHVYSENAWMLMVDWSKSDKLHKAMERDGDLCRLKDSSAYSFDISYLSPEAKLVNEVLVMYDAEPSPQAASHTMRGVEGSEEARAQELFAKARGGATEGLEKLSAAYSAALQGGGKSPAGSEEQEKALSNALLIFAQRLQFIANQEVLIEEHNGVLPTIVMFFTTLRWGGYDANDGQTSYVRVLQSISNSIIVELDELAEQRGYANRQTASLAAAKSAATQTGFPVDASATTPNQVWTQIRDTLVGLRIKELAESTAETQKAKEYAAGIELAQQQINNTFYLRPASAYLRTSYPSTSLQSNPPIGWQNQLEAQALRAVPFLPTMSAQGNKDAKVARELDKQFWQNINRVRVAGAGFGNQVIVKDDIGNWYVKSYSADTEKITAAAMSAASGGILARGGSTTMALANQLTNEKDRQLAQQHILDDQLKASDTQRQMLQFATEKRAADAADLAAVKEKEATFSQDLKKAVDAKLGDKSPVLDGLMAKPENAYGAPVDSDVNGHLQAMETYEDKILAVVKGCSLADGDKTTAIDTVTATAQAILAPLLKQRRATVDTYQGHLADLAEAKSSAN